MISKNRDANQTNQKKIIQYIDNPQNSFQIHTTFHDVIKTSRTSHTQIRKYY